MDGNTRRTRFENRVELEREFLTHVNQRFGRLAPLAGMTGDAIDAWQVRAREAGCGNEVDLVHDLLIEISKRAELIADHSRDVFDKEGRAMAGALDDLRVMLSKAMSMAR
ncbi:hypothetical protein ACTZWT_15565 [Rhodopseudomonas sp. NSM]|uniref:hypothetical protein n=1 Tax=Rhodopseudomonas sp. NSM TaxID=3457630 RepID=UPI004035399D